MSPVAHQVTEALRRLTSRLVRCDPKGGRSPWRTRTGRPPCACSNAERVTPARLAELAWEAGDDAIIVAPALTSEQARALREAGVNYLDAAGNARVNAGGTVALVQGQEGVRTGVMAKAAGRAFQPAGLKVLSVLLVDPARADETYRELAGRVGASPATVKYVLDDLERRSHVLKVGCGRGMRRLEGVADLARRWANAATATGSGRSCSAGATASWRGSGTGAGGGWP